MTLFNGIYHLFININKVIIRINLFRMVIYGKYRKWFQYESIKEVIDYRAAKNGGYEYVSKEAILHGIFVPVDKFISFLGYSDPDLVIRRIKSGEIDIEKAIIRWRSRLLEDGNAPQTIIRLNRGVKNWLKVNEVEVNWEKVDLKRPLPRKRTIVEDRIPTRDELRLIVSKARPKMAAIILLAASSGLRLGTIVALKICDIDLESDPEIGIIKVRPELSKNGYGYYALMSSEARDALEYYLRYRSQKEDLSKDSWLFPGMNGRHVHPRVIQKSWVNLLKKTGLASKSVKGGFYELHFHTLRKFFRTQLEGYLTKSEIERLMGHLHGSYLDGSYFRPLEEHLIARYKAAQHRLFILKSEINIQDIRKKTLLDVARMLGFDTKTLLQIESMLEYMSIEEVVKRLKRVRKRGI